MNLQELHDWMRENHVKRARLASGEELELLPVSKPAEERKRRAYEVELGHAVTDEMLERLP